MLARARIIALLLFLGSASYLVYHTWHITASDHAFYAKFTQTSDEQPLTQQEKRGVIKDAYYTKNGARQHTRISADRSILRAIPIGKNYELIETMQGIKGTMIDGEQTRTFSSKIGTYYYNSHEFITKMAHVQLFKDKLLVDGLAKEVRLRFDKAGSKFEATQITAHIPDTQELK